MRPSGTLCSLALLALSLVLSSHSSDATQPDVSRELRHRRLIQRARAAAMATQREWSRRAAEDFLSQVPLREDAVEDSEVSLASLREDLDVDLGVPLAPEPEPKYLPPRARRAECFYWKSFTYAPENGEHVGHRGKWRVTPPRARGTAQPTKEKDEKDTAQLRRLLRYILTVSEFYTHPLTTQKKMLSSRLQCALALLCLALAISCVSAAPSDVKLRQLLQRSLFAQGGKQELARLTLAELLSELAQAENEALESEEVSRGTEGEEGARFEVERSAGSLLAPRERKAGCKNFFWKTFTSC
ncbi:somatostatin 1, tandem duplicate 1 [Engraulis encrasicolus]|uniref:somatostatin 1, tandem duplicate 1 n=1 Tax=Engraulis encrasicolus TaxID=184585 RepID=UPI002FD667EC